MKYSDIYSICMPEKKRKEERFNIWVTLAVRPLSILLTKPFIGTAVIPTTITKWSVLAILIGFVLTISSTSLAFTLTGWLFFFLWAVLDGVDGNYARCSNQCSPLGDLWDTMGGYLAMVLIYLSAGIASYYHPELIHIGYKVPILILGCATATISIFPRLVMHKRKSSNIQDKAVNSISDKQNFSISKIAAMNLVSPSGFMQIIFLCSLVFNLLNLFVIFYFIVNSGIMLLSLRQLLR